MRKIILIIALFLFFTALIAGFFLTGGPKYQRKVLYDTKRAKNIHVLSGRIGSYYTKHNKLPDELADLNTLNNDLNNYLDPETKKLPDYKKAAEDRFHLCSTFSTSNLSDKKSKNNANRNYHYKRIKHPAGYHCVEYKKHPKNNYFSLVD